MEALITPALEWAVADLVQPGQSESGDRSVVLPTGEGGLVAVVDGLGHGAEAASAAKVAVRALERGANRPVVQLFRDCHSSLIGTRGAVISAAAFNARGETMTWLGVGDVEGRLLRAPSSASPRMESLLLRGGVVGVHLPTLVSEVVPIHRGDTLIFATDGVRSDFLDAPLPPLESQALADYILAHWGTQTDDALVLVVRYLGPS
jgi:negative regulator of sigma-B (phosphoserine phosphatase)